MPKQCKNCPNTFPYEKEIDGKVRNFSSRKYCLECSPFGEQNTNQLHKDKTGEKECTICGKIIHTNRTQGNQRLTAIRVRCEEKE